MRSTITLASKAGIAAIAAQQVEIGRQIVAAGLMPILEPEVSIKSPEKDAAEAILLDELKKGIDALPAGQPGHAEADDPVEGRFVRAADQPPEGGAGRGAVGRL